MSGKTSVIIAAGGSSLRMGGGDKLFADLSGTPVLMRTVTAFERAAGVFEIIIASKLGSIEKIRSLCREYNITKLKDVTESGGNRRESVHKALAGISANAEYIAIHDGARPLITPAEIDAIIAQVYGRDAVIPAIRVKDTVKRVCGDIIISTENRDELYLAQTPQIFSVLSYRQAIKLCTDNATDDAFIMEQAGFKVYITDGNCNNIKITTPEDLVMAKALIGPPELRIGTGYDVHRFACNRKLILCGQEIPHDEGLLGHSDADAAVHAAMDALLGAAALGDIGRHFPDTDPQYKGISSIKLLGKVIELLKAHGYVLGNLDITIIAERPRLASYIDAMRANIAETCGVSVRHVSVKATTEEGLGLAGKGISANVACIVKRVI